MGRRYSVWFVMIKDTKGRFKGNANWGEGWGWALFEAGNRNINTSKGYLESCLPCHVPAKQTGWVYIEGYPTLRATINTLENILSKNNSEQQAPIST